MNSLDKKRDKQQRSQMAKQKLKYEKLGLGFHYNMDYNTYANEEKKIELVESTTNRIYRYILTRYNIDPSQEKILRGLIRNELLKKDSYGYDLKINNVNRDIDQEAWYAYHFIENDLIKENSIVLQSI